MNRIIAENGVEVTDEMITDWEDALERDEWPTGWQNIGELSEERLPKSNCENVALSVKVPIGIKKAIEAEAKTEESRQVRSCEESSSIR
ncbi:hypothetical protein [Coriobacterium glomerans]|nr:hypothetical protein [Coriobacterium glomerans]